MLELYTAKVMYDITDILEDNEPIATDRQSIDKQMFDKLLKVREYLATTYQQTFTILSDTGYAERMIAHIGLSAQTIKQIYKIYNTCIRDRSYIIRIKSTEIFWSQQQDRFVVNDHDILYYSRDDMQELLGYIIYKLGNIISVPCLVSIIKARSTSTQSFNNYIRCCNYIKQIHNDIYDLHKYRWFKAQMTLHYGSENREARNE